MKIQLISDIHVEFWRGLGRREREQKLYKYLRPADVLIAAGDINTGRRNTLETLEFLARHYEDVIYFPGNHEYYAGLDIEAFDDEFIMRLPVNVHYLNPGQIVIKGITFIGATLWTNFDDNPLIEADCVRGINDFLRTKITPADMRAKFYEHSQYIKHAYEEAPGTVVIATHFLPAQLCVAPRFRSVDNISSSLNRYFANGLDDWIAELEDATWLFGHTHDAVDIVIGQTRCLARPVGYPGEHDHMGYETTYEPLVIEVW